MPFSSIIKRRDADTIWNRVAQMVGFSNGFPNFSVEVSGTALQPLSVPISDSLAATVANLPFKLDYEVQVNMPAGTYSGSRISGLIGGGPDAKFYLEGSTLPFSPTTGARSGTAGVGSTSTSLTKPTGAANWTVDNLRGRLVKITSGGGASGIPQRPALVLISSNTTTTAVIDHVGVDSTTVFELVEPGVVFSGTTALALYSNSAPIVVRGARFDGTATKMLDSQGNLDVTFEGCWFDFPVPATWANDKKVVVRDCWFTNGALPTCTDVSRVEIKACASYQAGAVALVRGDSAEVQLVANGNAGRALSLNGVKNAAVEVSANGCGATPIYAESVARLTAVGSNLLSGTGNTGYGLEIAKEGYYVLTGSTITGGTGDVLFLGNPVTWADLSNPGLGIASEHAATATANSGYTKALVFGNRILMGNLDVSGRLLLYGYLNVSSNLIVPTLTGSQVLDMETGNIDGAPGGFGSARSVLEVVNNGATASCNLPSNAAIAGCLVIIANRGTQALAVTSTGGTIIGTASVPANSSRMFVSLNGNGGRNYIAVG